MARRQPTTGYVEINGTQAQLIGPAAAISRGLICMFQELSLVPDLTVRENLMLGAPGTGLGRLDVGVVARAQDILVQIDGAAIRMNARVADLTLAERQQVEIAKALSRNPKLLILDEATSALNASVVEKVFHLIRAERDRGVGVLFISHRFHEIEALADRISIFRNGAHVETFDNGAYDYGSIISKMVGQRIDDLFPPKREADPDAEDVLRLEGWAGLMAKAKAMCCKACLACSRVREGNAQWVARLSRSKIPKWPSHLGLASHSFLKIAKQKA